MKKLSSTWDEGLDSESVSTDAFVSRDQPLKRLKRSVQEYESPIEPVGVKHWEALDPDGTGTQRGDARSTVTPG